MLVLEREVRAVDDDAGGDVDGCDMENDDDPWRKQLMKRKRRRTRVGGIIGRTLSWALDVR
jgi:hypothetical protein